MIKRMLKAAKRPILMSLENLILRWVNFLLLLKFMCVGQISFAYRYCVCICVEHTFLAWSHMLIEMQYWLTGKILFKELLGFWIDILYYASILTSFLTEHGDIKVLLQGYFWICLSMQISSIHWKIIISLKIFWVTASNQLMNNYGILTGWTI
jgi:hypothetical protein